MTTKPRKPSRKAPRASRPLPRSTEPDLPEHLKRLTACALIATTQVRLGASLTAIYLAAARALIREAERLSKAGM